MGAKRQGGCWGGGGGRRGAPEQMPGAQREVAFKELRKLSLAGTQKAHRPLLCSPERFKSSSTKHFPLTLVNRADDLVYM